MRLWTTRISWSFLVYYSVAFLELEVTNVRALRRCVFSAFKTEQSSIAVKEEDIQTAVIVGEKFR